MFETCGTLATLANMASIRATTAGSVTFAPPEVAKTI